MLAVAERLSAAVQVVHIAIVPFRMIAVVPMDASVHYMGMGAELWGLAHTSP